MKPPDSRRVTAIVPIASLWRSNGTTARLLYPEARAIARPVSEMRATSARILAESSCLECADSTDSQARIGLEPRLGEAIASFVVSNVVRGELAGQEDEGAGAEQEAMLDRGGSFGYLGFGYTHRFSTPLGSSPFVTLE